MRFSDSIEAGIYEPWRDKYMNYPELKHLLKTEEEAPSWGENDESKFVSVMDAQLEKVSSKRICLKFCITRIVIRSLN